MAKRKTQVLRGLGIAASAGMCFLTGCAMNGSGSGMAENAVVTGRAMGGRQPVVGASVGLYATGNTGYGSAATTLGTATTDANGNFSITRGGATCADPQQVYLVASGGNPGSGTNTASVLVSALGPCSSITAATSGLVINELTTVAAAYALQGFADTSVNLGTSSTNAQGLTHGFANATSLVALDGVVNATTPGGNGAIPTTLINTLGDILASCVNSTGPTSNSCAAILQGAPSAVNAATPANVWQEALNMARYPAYNVAAIYAGLNSTPPYQPAFPTAPSDFSIGIPYTAGLQSNGTTAATFPWDIKADASDNVWVSGMTNAGLVELSPNGTLLSPAGGWGTAGLQAAFTHDLAWDKLGNVYAADNAGYVWKYTPAGTTTAPTQGTTVQITAASGAVSVGVDSANNAWFGTYVSTAATTPGFGEILAGTATASTLTAFSSTANKGSYVLFVDASNQNAVFSDSQSIGVLYQYNAAGSVTTSPSAGSNPTGGVVADKSHNIWAVYQGSGSNKGALLKYASGTTTVALTCTPQITSGSGLYNPRGLVIDGNNRLFVNSYTAGSIVEFDPSVGTGCDATGDTGYFFLNAAGGGISPVGNAGTAIMPASGQRNSTIDSSGAFWTINALSSSTTPVIQILGIAAPTNPVLANGVYGTRP